MNTTLSNNHFSVAELVKSSAYAIFVRRQRGLPRKVTDNMIIGDEYAKRIAKEWNALIEVGGKIVIEDIILHFSIDAVILPRTFIEIKWVNPAWNSAKPLFEVAKRQAATYGAILRRKPDMDIEVPDDFEMKLWFKEQMHDIEPSDKALQFIVNKAHAILRGNIQELLQIDMSLKTARL